MMPTPLAPPPHRNQSGDHERMDLFRATQRNLAPQSRGARERTRPVDQGRIASIDAWGYVTLESFLGN